MCLNWLSFGVSLLNPKVFSAVHGKNGSWKEKHGPKGGLVRLTCESCPETLSSYCSLVVSGKCSQAQLHDVCTEQEVDCKNEFPGNCYHGVVLCLCSELLLLVNSAHWWITWPTHTISSHALLLLKPNANVLTLSFREMPGWGGSTRWRTQLNCISHCMSMAISLPYQQVLCDLIY